MSHYCIAALGCLGDTQFSFRIRQSVGHKLSMNGEEEKYNRDAPVVLQVCFRVCLTQKCNLLYSR